MSTKKCDYGKDVDEADNEMDERYVYLANDEGEDCMDFNDDLHQLAKDEQSDVTHDNLEISEIAQEDQMRMTGHVSQRLGYWSKKRTSEYRTKDNFSRFSDWSKKLKRPRLGMIADLEEEKLGRKSMKMTIVKDFNSNRHSPIKHFNQVVDFCDENEVEDDSPLVVHLINDRVIHERSPSPTTFKRTFLSSSKKYSSGIDTFEISDKDVRGEEPCSRRFHFKTPSEGKSKVAENKHVKHSSDTTSPKVEKPIKVKDTVIEKIAALKEIDKKLLDIEREKRQKLKSGLKQQKSVKQNSNNSTNSKTQGGRASSARYRNRRVVSSSSSSSSSGSSSSSSSSSSDTDDDNVRSRDERIIGGKSSKQKSSVRVRKKNINKNSSGGKFASQTISTSSNSSSDTVQHQDLKEKLKSYLNKAKSKERKNK